MKAVRTVTLSLLRSEKCRSPHPIPLTERPQDSQTERISKYSPTTTRFGGDGCGWTVLLGEETRFFYKLSSDGRSSPRSRSRTHKQIGGAAGF